jgi:hypothetical protein
MVCSRVSGGCPWSASLWQTRNLSAWAHSSHLQKTKRFVNNPSGATHSPRHINDEGSACQCLLRSNSSEESFCV